MNFALFFSVTFQFMFFSTACSISANVISDICHVLYSLELALRAVSLRKLYRPVIPSRLPMRVSDITRHVSVIPVTNCVIMTGLWQVMSGVMTDGVTLIAGKCDAWRDDSIFLEICVMKRAVIVELCHWQMSCRCYVFWLCLQTCYGCFQ